MPQLCRQFGPGPGRRDVTGHCQSPSSSGPSRWAVLTDDHASMPRLRPRIPDGGCLRARIVCCRTPHRAPSTKRPRQRPLSSAHMGSRSSFTPLADCSASLAGLTSCQQRDVNELAASDVFWLTCIVLVLVVYATGQDNRQQGERGASTSFSLVLRAVKQYYG
jgi:hypothetical protein